MADIDFPIDLSPFRMTHWLQPHIGGSESPVTRTRKVYELSRPKWMSKLSFRGLASEYGDAREAEIPPVLDSLIIRMRGGANRIALWDMRRPYPRGLTRYYRQFLGDSYSFGGGETFTLGERFFVPPEAEPPNEFALKGADAITFFGFKPGEQVLKVGDYFGGDGRMHMFHNNGHADADGRVTMRFDPPLERDMLAGTAVFMRPTTMMRLVGEDAGAATEEVGQATVYSLDFEEDLP